MRLPSYLINKETVTRLAEIERSEKLLKQVRFFYNAKKAFALLSDEEREKAKNLMHDCELHITLGFEERFK